MCFMLHVLFRPLSFTDLLEAVTAADGPLEGTDVMVRLGMTNPPYVD